MGCKKCDEDKTLARGVGDTLARVIHDYTGIKPCSGCKDRQEKLNKWIPYKKKPWKGKIKLRIRDRIRRHLIRWVRNIAFKKLISMERKLARLNIAIQRRNTKKVSSERKAFEAGRLHERKILIEVLQSKRDRAQSLWSRGSITKWTRCYRELAR